MIVINARFLTQKTTGVQRFAIEICNRLPNSIGGKEIIFVVPNSEIISKLKDNKRIVLTGNLKGQLWEQIDLPLFLKKNNNPLLINFVGISPVIYKNKIMFLYDLAFKHHPEWFSFLFQKTYNLLIPKALKNSKLVVTDSNYVKTDIQESYGIEDGKIKVIYAAPATMFKNMDLEKEKIILTVSSIDPRKNLFRTIEAFNKIESDYKLVIVGAKNKAFSKVVLDESLLNDKIIFTGYLEDEELLNMYNKAEIFIYASLFEGFGIPPLEAQSCGCACIVSNTTSLPEVYGDSVEYCNPYSIQSIENKLVELIKNRKRIKELQSKGEQNMKKYSWNTSSEIFIKILESVV